MWRRGTSYRVRGEVFTSGNETPSSVARGAVRYQRFILIYKRPACKLHRSHYRGIPACPTRNSLTFTCGLRLPSCRMLVTTISSQSR